MGEEKKQYCITRMNLAANSDFKERLHFHISIMPFEDYASRFVSNKYIDSEYLIDCEIPFKFEKDGNGVFRVVPNAEAPNAPDYDTAYEKYAEALATYTAWHLSQLGWYKNLTLAPVTTREEFINIVKGAVNALSDAFRSYKAQPSTDEKIVSQNEDIQHEAEPTEPIEMTQAVAGYIPNEERVVIEIHYTDKNNAETGEGYFTIQLPYMVERENWSKYGEVNPTAFCKPIAPQYCQDLIPFNNISMFGKDLDALMTAMAKDINDYIRKHVTLYKDVTALKDDVVSRLSEVLIMYEQKLLDTYRTIRFQPPKPASLSDLEVRLTALEKKMEEIVR